MNFQTPHGTQCDLSNHNDIWIPTHDIERLRNVGIRENLPDFDVKKVKAAGEVATQRRRALDIGAHIGVTAILLSRMFSVVDAFEAVGETYAALRLNAEGKAINTYFKAISDQPGFLRFEHRYDHGQLSHVLLDGEKLKLVNSIVTPPVEAITIDSLNYDDVDFMKIDVEGFEGPVVFGAKETILRCRPVVLMEQRGNEVSMHGRERDEASKFVMSLGMVEVTGMPFHKDKVFRFPDVA